MVYKDKEARRNYSRNFQKALTTLKIKHLKEFKKIFKGLMKGGLEKNGNK